MARRQQEFGAGRDEPTVATVGRLALRSGAVLSVLALPLAVGAFLAVVLAAPSLMAGLDGAAAAVQGPLGTAVGVAWLLHLGVLGLLVGAWLTGAGLLLSALLD
jgi:hypothetical protein